MSLARNIGNLPNGDDAPVYACRAWVNFDGTTNTAGYCTIRDSGNVSTVADNGTGDYTVNFTTAMPDANYTMVGTASRFMLVNADATGFSGTDQTSSLVRIKTYANTFSTSDGHYVSVAIFR